MCSQSPGHQLCHWDSWLLPKVFHALWSFVRLTAWASSPLTLGLSVHVLFLPSVGSVLPQWLLLALGYLQQGQETGIAVFSLHEH